MAVNRERLELFYSISCEWTVRDQRFQAAIGSEFEIAEAAFTNLLELCNRHTNSEQTEWQPPREALPFAAIMARAFVDHTTKVQRLVRTYLAGDGVMMPLCDTMRDQHRSIFDLRNALHHQDERIQTGKSFELLQPLCGDLSWLVWTESSQLDLYWMSFGPMIGDEGASPGFGPSMVSRPGLNEIIYRAHDIEVHLISVFRGLVTFVEAVHDELLRRFDRQLQKLGIERGGSAGRKLPSELAGRLRIEGFEAVPS